mmetsp:Transcript_6182/g.6384  ORF Transcript_6182/g.6384 Transcript_6182/m.6384 type:complete len:800 (-) Transcript_6182:419-2818(-)|eukprot:CAMPEP_0182421890 /NCGR_PEP_ID=MMETSP1167-20130531/7434_1 /TAXON_ID=2988 /ORGANISM="Mallomonas Sp, Strain CCMP3275" /LENGTH=799 /DNA_ID=CAMNT_0024599485 /DNA_START=246 /DNA_END=2645 /DNA_ORIENTATION=-
MLALKRGVSLSNHLSKRYVPNPFSISPRFIHGNSNQRSNAFTDFLLSIPKGFKKFYPKRGVNDKAGKTGAESGKAGSTSKGFGGGSGGKKPDRSEIWRAVGALLAGTATLIVILGSDSNSGREISWQEFHSQLLESGSVDRIIVTNKNVARVVLRRTADTPSEAEISSSRSESTEWKMDLEPSLPPPIAVGGTSPEASATDSGSPAKYRRYPRLGSPVNPKEAQFYFSIGSVESFERKLEEAQLGLGIQRRDFVPVLYVSETNWTQEAMRFAPTLLLIGAYFLVMRGTGGGVGGGPGNIFRIGKSTAKKIDKESVTTTFRDVAGCDEAKREIMEFVQFLKTPKKFTDLGAKIPRGALLSGPPGTGKTLLAKATAGEANVPFYSMSGSDFVEMFVGVGPSRVRDLFKEARANAPCIIFIDEIDAVGRQRGRGGFAGGNDERENTLNQLLVEMDGFDTQTNVVVLAGTNRPDILDQALTRPGRFDRQIVVDKPDIQGRKLIFDVHLEGLTLAGDSSDFSARLAALTPGFVGADIANICNEAAIVAARADKQAIDLSDFEQATDRVIGGLESNKLISAEERRIVAFHEAGHAVAGWNLKYADPLLKVTIVPRSSGALGFAQYLPKEIFLRTEEQIMDMVCMALAGRAAEQVHFGRVTTGAADDLRRVTQIVYQMVQVYGMNQRVGQVAFPKDDGGYPGDRLYCDQTAQIMDEEVRVIVDKSYQRTLTLMDELKEQVRLVAELLLEKETITHADVAEIIGKRPFSTTREYKQFVDMSWKKPVKKNDGKEDSSIPESPTNLSPA